MRAPRPRWSIVLILATTLFLACGGEESGCDNPYVVSADGDMGKVHFRFEGEYLAGDYDFAQAPVTPHEWIAIHANYITWEGKRMHPALRLELWPRKAAEPAPAPEAQPPSCDVNGCTAAVRTRGAGEYLLAAFDGDALADLLVLHFEPIHGMELIVEGPIATGTYDESATAPVSACVHRALRLDFLARGENGTRMVGIPDVCIGSGRADLFHPFLASAGTRDGDLWRLTRPAGEYSEVTHALIFEKSGTFTLDAAFCNAPEIHREFQVAVEAAGAACDASHGENSIFSAE